MRRQTIKLHYREREKTVWWPQRQFPPERGPWVCGYSGGVYTRSIAPNSFTNSDFFLSGFPMRYYNTFFGRVFIHDSVCFAALGKAQIFVLFLVVGKKEMVHVIIKLAGERNKKKSRDDIKGRWITRIASLATFNPPCVAYLFEPLKNTSPKVVSLAVVM